MVTKVTLVTEIILEYIFVSGKIYTTLTEPMSTTSIPTPSGVGGDTQDGSLERVSNLDWPDLLVIILYFVFVIGVGVWVSYSR